MKRISFLSWPLILVFVSGLVVTGCSSEESSIQEPQEVELTLDYTFMESGNMTRATGSEVYTAFYEKYIRTKVLTPKNYHLEFIIGSETVLTINGQWESTKNIRLPEGEYSVIGYSIPIEKYADRASLPSDSVYMKFNEKVSIKKDMKTLTLKAIYDSFLLLFDTENKSDIVLNIGEKSLNHDNSCYWIFAKEKSWSNWDNGFNFTHILSADIFMSNGDKLNVALGKLPLEIGKYYYFNDMTNSFDIPAMESGN